MAHHKTLIASVALAAALAVTVATARSAYGQRREDDEKTSAREWPPTKPAVEISPIRAMAVAKARLGGGTPFVANFEFDEGHWVYGVMVVKGHRISEVEVDPISGRAIASEAVNPAGESAETIAMLKKVAAAGG